MLIALATHPLKIVVQDPRCPQSFHLDPSFTTDRMQDMNPNRAAVESDLQYAFIEDNIPIVHEQDFIDVTKFEKLYLTGKVLGESIPLKLIISKGISDGQLISEVNIVDM